MIAMVLARIVFILAVVVSFGFLCYLAYKRFFHPLMFEEEMEEKLMDAGEDYVEKQVDEKADQIRKEGTGE